MLKKPKTIVLTILLIFLLCFSGPLVYGAYQDFTAYTEVDPNSNITVYNSTHVKQHVVENEDAYLYDDKGASYFDDFEHIVDALIENKSGTPMAFCWALTNAVDDRKDLYDANDNYLAVRLEDDRIAIEECDLGTLYTDVYMTSTLGNWYYFRVYKLSTTFNLYIYNNTARSAPYLEDTLSLTLHTPPTYRYVFATWLRDRGNPANIDLLTANLDLGFVAEYVEPQYNLIGLNSTLNGSGVQFTFNLSDDTALDYGLFEWNNSGTLTNTSYDLVDSLTFLLLINQTLNETSGARVDYRLLFNDTSNNWNATVQHFLYTNTEPVLVVGLTPAQYFIGALLLGCSGGILYFLATRKKR